MSDAIRDRAATRDHLAILLAAAPDESLARVGETLRDVLSCPTWCIHTHNGDEVGGQSMLHHSPDFEFTSAGYAKLGDSAESVRVCSVWESDDTPDSVRVALIVGKEEPAVMTILEAAALGRALLTQVAQVDAWLGNRAGQSKVATA